MADIFNKNVLTNVPGAYLTLCMVTLYHRSLKLLLSRKDDLAIYLERKKISLAIDKTV